MTAALGVEIKRMNHKAETSMALILRYQYSLNRELCQSRGHSIHPISMNCSGAGYKKSVALGAYTRQQFRLFVFVLPPSKR